MYHVELYNRTAGRVIKCEDASSDKEASKVAMDFINTVKAEKVVIQESGLDISPRGFVFGQTLYTTEARYDITTAKK